MPNLTFINKNGSPHLLLIFAGWGMDANPFIPLHAPGYDIAVAWDHTDESLDIEQLRPYREVVLFAWSMGVLEAERIMAQHRLPVTLSVAVNGTRTPVNDRTGIPTAIFEGTLKTLSSATLARFNRRMCGSAENLSRFNANAPSRSIESLRAELELLGKRPTACSGINWDVAVTGAKDMIFPVANQRNAWQDVRLLETDEPHLPDFQSLIDRLIVNKDRVALRFDSTRTGYDSDATTQHMIAAGLAAKLQQSIPENKKFERCIEIGAGSGRLTRQYAGKLDIERLELWDIAPIAPESVPAGAIKVIDDAEARLFDIPDNSVDLIISASTMQWFNSPCQALRQIQRIMRPGAIAAISLYTEGTYRTLSAATGVSINYVTPQSLLNAVTEPCRVVHSETTCHTKDFESTRALIDHMRSTGVNAAGTTSPGTLRKMLTDNQLRTLEYNNTTIIIAKQ